MSDRPRVGPADPETRRKMLQQKLNEPTKATGVAPKTEEPESAKEAGAEGVLDALNPKKPRQRRVGPKGQTLDEVIDEAIKGAEPDHE